MSKDFTETIDQYCYEVWGHTDWAFEDTLVNSEEGRKELLRGHTIEGGIVFFHEEEEEFDPEHWDNSAQTLRRLT